MPCNSPVSLAGMPDFYSEFYSWNGKASKFEGGVVVSNMSYCRFRNTSGDLADCLDSIRQGCMMRSDEAGFGRSMFKEFLTFCRDYDIIEGFDGEAVDAIFQEITKEV